MPGQWRHNIPSCILIRYRSTYKRYSRAIKIIALFRLVESLLTLIGSCRIYYVFKINAGRFRKRHSFIQLELAGTRLFNCPRVGVVDGSHSNPREFHPVGVCTIDRTDCARTRSKLK